MRGAFGGGFPGAGGADDVSPQPQEASEDAEEERRGVRDAVRGLRGIFGR